MKCLSCNGSYKSYEIEDDEGGKYDECVTKCPKGYSPLFGWNEFSNKKCEKCPQKCENCSQFRKLKKGKWVLETICNECKENYFYFDWTCLKSCPEKTYPSKSKTKSQICRQCFSNCLRCSNSNSCDKCEEGYFLKNSNTSCGNTQENHSFYSTELVSFIFALFFFLIACIAYKSAKYFEKVQRKKMMRRRRYSNSPLVDAGTTHRPLNLPNPEAEGVTNPLEPVDINSSDVQSVNVHICLPCTEKNFVLRQDSLIEIKVMKEKEDISGGGEKISFDQVSGNGKKLEMVSTHRTRPVMSRREEESFFKDEESQKKIFSSLKPYSPPNMRLREAEDNSYCKRKPAMLSLSSIVEKKKLFQGRKGCLRGMNNL